ncbi:MAG: alanine racemase, partial [Gammaproteobacteria bacterium]
AYGHGLVPIAQAAQSMGIDYLGVSCLQEAVLLRQAGIQCRILVLGSINERQVSEFLTYHLELTISSLAKAKLLARACAGKKDKVKVHVKVDTGMHRTGTRVDSTEEVLNYICDSGCFEVVGIYSHFATSDRPDDPFAKAQIEMFRRFKEKAEKDFPKAIFHLANSGGIVHYPESHFDMVRPGKLVFGVYPTDLLPTQSTFTVKAKISYFKVVPANQGVSYGHTHRTSTQTRVVTVPLGYGDGYRRGLSNKSHVLIHGKKYPVIGTICMDQFMVDIGEDSAYVGDEVVLVGRQGNNEITLEYLAQLCDTIPSEMLCGFNDRLPRMYVDDMESYWEYNTLKRSTLLKEGEIA